MLVLQVARDGKTPSVSTLGLAAAQKSVHSFLGSTQRCAAQDSVGRFLMPVRIRPAGPARDSRVLR